MRRDILHFTTPSMFDIPIHNGYGMSSKQLIIKGQRNAKLAPHKAARQ